jgi:hypothetical protein
VLRDLVQTQVSTVEGRRGGRAEGGKEGRLEAMKRRKEGGVACGRIGGDVV